MLINSGIHEQPGRWLTKNSDADRPIPGRTQQNTVDQQSAIFYLPLWLLDLFPSTPLSQESFAPQHASPALQSLMRPKYYVANTSCLSCLSARITHANAMQT